MTKEFWTVTELSLRVGLAVETVRYHCRLGRMRGLVDTDRSGAQWRIPADVADQFAAWVTNRKMVIRRGNNA